jgi:hypothetical protein
MTEQQWRDLIALMQNCLNAVTTIKAHPEWADSRCMAVAATHLETAMLWVANGRKESDAP